MSYEAIFDKLVDLHVVEAKIKKSRIAFDQLETAVKHAIATIKAPKDTSQIAAE